MDNKIKAGCVGVIGAIFGVFVANVFRAFAFVVGAYYALKLIGVEL
jgi:hypothetical protein